MLTKEICRKNSMTTFETQIADSALLIIGHGRTGSETSTILIKQHTKSIKEKNLFKEVHCGFIKLKPLLTDQLSAIKNDLVYIVPCFAGPGNITKSIIPEKLRLSGAITKNKNQIIRYSEPVGSHPKIIDRMCELALKTFSDSRFPKNDTTLIVIGHGSIHNPQSATYTNHVAEQISLRNISNSVITLFLDQSPNLVDWSIHCQTTNAIILNYLFSGGTHEMEDIPKCMGFKPSTVEERLLNNRPIGPIYSQDKRLWLCPLISADQIISDIIIERVREMNLY
jgi:sirohydrochlorin cobaltochelatase